MTKAKPGHVRLICEECGDIGEDVPAGAPSISDAIEDHWADNHQPFISIVRPEPSEPRGRVRG